MYEFSTSKGECEEEWMSQYDPGHGEEAHTVEGPQCAGALGCGQDLHAVTVGRKRQQTAGQHA